MYEIVADVILAAATVLVVLVAGGVLFLFKSICEAIIELPKCLKAVRLYYDAVGGDYIERSDKMKTQEFRSAIGRVETANQESLARLR